MDLLGFVWALKTDILIATFALLSVYWLRSWISRNRKLPPGPLGLPIVGYMPFLTKKPHLKFQQLSETYGDIFSLRLGGETVVVLNSSSAIKEAFSKPELLGRPPQAVFGLSDLDSPFFLNGKLWREHRTYSLHALRDLGLGKSHMAADIIEEIRHLVEIVKKEEGKPIDLIKFLTPSVSNNICSLVFGKRYEYDDKVRIFMDQALQEVTKYTTHTSVFVFLPWLKKLPFMNYVFQYDLFLKAFNSFRDFIRKNIAEHKKTLDPTNLRDFIDSYLLEKETRLERDPTTTFSEKLLVGSVQTLFGAGSETLRTTVIWCLYTMAAYPEVQSKVHKEIDDIIGRERCPDCADQKTLLYTQSVLTEIQRWKTTVPLGVLRIALDRTDLGGYSIPKDTFVMSNLWAAHHDRRTWENPEEFVPDRFLSSDGKTIIKSENFMPFSYGKRSCPGEGLAVVEVFLYFAIILQNFTIKLPEDEAADFEGDMSITYHLKHHKLRLIPRK